LLKHLYIKNRPEEMLSLSFYLASTFCKYQVNELFFLKWAQLFAIVAIVVVLVVYIVGKNFRWQKIMQRALTRVELDCL
jgi:uncharacterized membrane protein